MSERDDNQDGIGQREVAYRLFASEFDDADFSYSESDEERAPNYVITPTGARANRVFVVGVLTEVEAVGEDVLRARVVDPTGAFVLYAGQYQPDEMAFLDRAEAPSFVAVTGKARTFQPDDSDAVYTSIRPESLSTVDAATRDRWTVQTATQTLERIEQMATALSLDLSGEALTDALEDRGVDDALAAGIPLALDHYGTTPAYLAALRSTALDALRLVSGDIDEIETDSIAPDAPGEADLDALAGGSVDSSAAVPDAGSDAQMSSESSEQTSTAASATSESTPNRPSTDTASVSAASEPDDGSESAPAADSDPQPTQTADDTESESESRATSEPAKPDGETASESDVDFDPESDSDSEIGDFDPGEFELNEDERAEIEDEFGTEFQSGTEVPDPGESDIETPDAEAGTEADPEAEPAETATTTAADGHAAGETSPGTETVTDTDTADAAESDTDAGAEGEAAAAADVDTEDAVIEVMEELDEGDGVDRSALVDAVSERHGVSTDEVEAAIQDALMSGRCYEPDDATLKSI